MIIGSGIMIPEKNSPLPEILHESVITPESMRISPLEVAHEPSSIDPEDVLFSGFP